ncbi:MAG: hypothetical protein KJ058_03690 [Thermoanaerobaculia bacterium]|nr:hypothetical protein [Thermoanaerobaculia bacterium]
MTEAIVNFCVRAYGVLLPIAWITVLLAILILGPLAIVRRTRGVASVGFVVASFVIGLTLWFLGASVTFACYGWTGFFIGLFLFGVGVVPIGIFAAFFTIKSTSLALGMIVMAVITIASRAGGVVLAKATE